MSAVRDAFEIAESARSAAAGWRPGCPRTDHPFLRAWSVGQVGETGESAWPGRIWALGVAGQKGLDRFGPLVYPDLLISLPVPATRAGYLLARLSSVTIAGGESGPRPWSARRGSP